MAGKVTVGLASQTLWYIELWTQWPRKGDEHHVYTPVRSMAHFTFLSLYECTLVSEEMSQYINTSTSLYFEVVCWCRLKVEHCVELGCSVVRSVCVCVLCV